VDSGEDWRWERKEKQETRVEKGEGAMERVLSDECGMGNG